MKPPIWEQNQAAKVIRPHNPWQQSPGGPDQQRQQQPGSVTVRTHCPARPLTECLPADTSAEGGARRGGQDRRRRVDERSGPLIVKKGKIR
jgi:hypothetical protein